MSECQRAKATFLPIEAAPCAHVADFTLYVPSREQQIILCGCCFLTLIKARGFMWFHAVIDIRTGMMLPPHSAMSRATRLN